MLLQGLKVVEFASYIAAPGAGGVLADWGAEVIKVERPEGDPMRQVFGDARSTLSGNPTFGLDNRGKRAVVLDISKSEGREALTRLATGADIFLTNVRPASLKRAGLDDETLRAINPRLIYAVVTGYGLEGPDAGKPGFDVTAFWSRAGVAHMHAPKGTDPFILRTGVGDHMTSLATVSAILAAVYEREKTGVGRLVQTSLLATGVYAVSSDLAVQLAFGKLASNRPRSAPFDPVANFYKSRDGQWFVVNPRGASKDWQLLAAACDRPDLPDDERFLTGRLRKDNSAALVAELDQAFSAIDFAEIARRLDEVDLVWAPVQTPAQVVDDPQVAAAGALLEVEDGQGGTYRSPAAPARFPGADATVRPAAPGLGQHTREVLVEIGYSGAEIEAMLAAGAAA
ncbi:CaiB/BaiF CoA-transferase family protein [Phenylobacterium sp. Root700]|uniref:CaiB/BaiF CoA transferase family protein n=1 Tax=Phenylobacterium sp. Root700 TaxID=1736591 RepID=UPI000AB9C28C|nr:CaiB/BaiF CoA-transferase family protein [Phenylobacterium sp. Root700]